MGLLDDAIRQHLELKRQHGADPAEVAGKEREAFGPIKRGDLEVGVGPEADEPVQDDAGELAPQETWAEEPAPEAPGSVAEEPVAESVALEPAPEAPGSVALEPAREPFAEDVLTGEATATSEDAPVADEPFPAPLDEPFAPSAEPSAYAPVPAEPVEPAYEPPAPAELPAEPFQDIGEPTQEYSVLDDAPDPQPDGAPGEHDELEETPDFLEETPEHDRLWFEQKPPRDFDF